MQAIQEYFERHEEQAFIAKAFLTIFLIILVKTYLGENSGDIRQNIF